MAKRDSPTSRWLADWEAEIKSTWDSLPSKTRTELEKVLGQLPGGLKGWRELIDHALRQVALVSGDKHRVVIVGPANAGKSTLFNSLIRAREERAAVSAIPGTTRRTQQGDAGIFSLVDTPGADSVGGLGPEEKERALQAAKQGDFLIVLFDASHGIRGPEREIYELVLSLGIPHLIAINKMDLVRRESAQVIGQAAAALGLPVGELIPISALREEGLERLLRTIAEREPALVAALGAALPAYRWKLAQVVIGRAASASAAIGLTPLPFLDFIPLVGVQMTMVLAIARIYAFRMTLGRVREILATVGIGALGRTLFYELSKLGGPPTWLIAAGVAAGTTAALGYGAAIWFERGEELTAERLRAVSRTFSRVLVDRLRSLGRGRPGRASLRERVEQALLELPPPADFDALPAPIGEENMESERDPD